MQLPCLDIIIPHYKESYEMINHLLMSINNQVGLNLAKAIKVTIVNDCNDDGYNELLKLKSTDYLFHFDILKTPKNGGAGLGRQYGIDHTNLPYIMFIDADDRLWDCAALLKVLNCVRLLDVKQQKWNYIWSNFYEEQFIGEKGYDLLPHDQASMIWLHGKVWNRKFLEDNNIKFHETLRTFEDTYFGKIVALSAPKTLAYHCTDFTYLWRRNPDSVTSNWNHDDRDYLYWNYKDYLTCTYDVLKFFYPKYNSCARWEELFFSSLYFTYFLLQMSEYSDIDNPETKRRRDELDNLFINIIKNFGNSVINLKQSKKAFWYSEVRKDIYGHYKGFTFEHTSYNEYLEYLYRTYGIDCSGFELDWEKI